MYAAWSYAVYLLFLIDSVRLLENGLARLPPMGWMSWGYYMCGVKCNENPNKCLDEKLILSVVDTIYMEGYQEAGYEYIIIDDCWSEKTRNIHGKLVPDHKRFPRGMKFIADYIHARGLKFGMYTNIAATTCMQYPGSKGHFAIDAKTFAEWDVDYLKVDGCFVEEDYLNVAYIKLGHYLNKTGRPMVYSCSWPYYIKYIIKKKPDFGRVLPHCNLWRNFHDVVMNWYMVREIIKYFEREYPKIAPYHGPGHWNDPDMLVVGTQNLTAGQSRVQMSVFALLSAPLLLSCDMRTIAGYERDILLNLDLIAIAQDPLGIMAQPYKINQDITIWLKPHLPMKGNQFHSFSFGMVNLSDESHYVSFIPQDYGLNSTDSYTVLDVFGKQYIRNVTLKDSLGAIVPPSDVVLYTLYPL